RHTRAAASEPCNRKASDRSNRFRRPVEVCAARHHLAPSWLWACSTLSFAASTSHSIVGARYADENRWVPVQVGEIRMLRRAAVGAAMPLPGLPAAEWRATRCGATHAFRTLPDRPRLTQPLRRPGRL